MDDNRNGFISSAELPGLSNANFHRGWEKDTLAPLLYATNLLPVLSVSLMEQKGQIDYRNKITQ